MKLRAILGTLAFLAMPGFVAGLVPWLLCSWVMRPPFFGVGAIRIVAALAIVVGAAVLLDSFRRFALEGLGTPAPIAPTEHLVVRGFYRYVRNPMYVAVILTILGQALFFGSRAVLVYAVVVWLVTLVFVISYEEPTLRERYGTEYEQYCSSVPRWLPRLLPKSYR
jgi:protein-S-isoprenylcysteine O-methyltransferase Ste14